MQIQNVSNVNFQATKVLSVKRSVAPRKKELVEVFRLDEKTDTEFIKKCVDLLSKTKMRDLSMFQRRLKNVLGGFLEKANSFSEDYYIAIKNDENIIGCMNSVPFMKDVIPLNLFVSENPTQNTAAMFYALLSDSQKSYIGFDIKLDELSRMKAFPKTTIKYDKIKDYMKNIKENTSLTRFKVEEEKNISLDDVLGTRNFETEIYPNLK